MWDKNQLIHDNGNLSLYEMTDDDYWLTSAKIYIIVFVWWSYLKFAQIIITYVLNLNIEEFDISTNKQKQKMWKR